MRNAIQFCSVLFALWMVGCNHCTATTDDRFVPTQYPADDTWDYLAFGDGCSVHDETGASTKTGKPCWTDLEAHADEWKALPCEDVCLLTTVTGRTPSSCEPMRKTADGRYRIKCTWETCSGGSLGSGWGAGNGGEF